MSTKTWLSLAATVLLLGGVVVSILAIAPPHIFAQPRFYVLVAAEMIVVWGFAMVVTRHLRSRH